MRRCLPALVSAFLLLLTTTVGTAAQGGSQAGLSPPETEAFPLVAAYLSVSDAQGNFISELQPADVSVLEDNQPLPVSALELLRPGVQMVLAVNHGPAFAIRDVQGLTRYDYLVAALQAWSAARAGSTLDDLSLVANVSQAARHLSDAAALVAALQAYQPDGQSVTPSYDLLGAALEMAADPTSRPGMGRTVLFITGLPKEDTSIGLQSLAARASQRGIRVYVWLVASSDQFDTPAAVQLAELAVLTNGAFTAFSGVEPLPDLEIYLESLRSTYRLEYQSQINASGSHRLAVRVMKAHIEVQTAEQEFDLEISPPNIAFISPQLEIRRTSAADANDFSPARQVLEILIEFPDGYERALSQTILYVDGEAVVVNSAPPFDRFDWDLSVYTLTGGHILRAEAIDVLGLRSASVDIPVSVVVTAPERNVLVTVSQNKGLLAGLAAALAGSVLILVLILGGRLSPGALQRLRRRPARPRPPLAARPDEPKTETTSQRLPNWINRLHWPQRRLAPQAAAFLVCLPDSDHEIALPPISIFGGELTFGSDPTLATQVLDDPSVDPLHARLRKTEDDTFRISDEGSVAGTWVNYTPVSQAGLCLEHGDLVHFGKAGFRFNLRASQRVRRPTSIPEEPQL